MQEVLRLLLEAGGVDSGVEAIANDEGNTPMHSAAYAGRAEVVRMLLANTPRRKKGRKKKKIPLNANFKGISPMHVASSLAFADDASDHGKVLQLLAEHSGQINQRTEGLDGAPVRPKGPGAAPTSMAIPMAVC